MKALTFISLGLVFGFNLELHAQASATANIFATIVTPISIEKVVGKDLNFGNIAAGQSGGAVILNASGTRQAQGGAVLPSSNGTITAAEFVVSGEGSNTFSITLPSVAVTLINSSSASHVMTVDSFTSSPEATGTLSSGKQTIKVGARLNLGAHQAPGTYSSSAPFTVMVNYN